jgi:predicted transcriptional regulator
MEEITMNERTVDLKSLTADIVGAHVANNSLAASDVPLFIKSVYDALSTLGGTAEPASAEQKAPSVSIRSSIKPDYLVCLEDGKKLTMLKRYLAVRFGLTPEQYRQKWRLPKDYPMGAPNYSETRKALANAMGLGRKPGVGVAAEVAANMVQKVEAATKPVAARAKKVAAVFEKQIEAAVQPVRARAGKVAAQVFEAAPPVPRARGRKPKSA